MDTYTEREDALEIADLLDLAFHHDAEETIATARSWSRGSAMFLARRLGPAAAYEIASQSADDIILYHAGELAVPNEAARKRPSVGYGSYAALSMVAIGGMFVGIGIALLLR